MADKKKPETLQIRVDRADQRGAQLASKIAKIAEMNGLSMNDVANLSMAAGLPMVETKLQELREPAKAA